MVQLWVNLPAKDKMTPPSYQTLLQHDIPQLTLPNEAGTLRVIAGEYDGQRGPAHTFSAMDVWDLRLKAGKTLDLHVIEGRNTALIVLHGTVQVNDSQVLRETQMVLFDQAGDALKLEANGDAVLLLLSGEPIDEPIAGYGPFVMNTQQEITQAMQDFQAGKFGRMPQDSVTQVAVES